MSIDINVFIIYNTNTMLKIKNLTKYTFFATALALTVFAVVPGGVKAQEYPSYYSDTLYPSYYSDTSYPSYYSDTSYPSYYSDTSYPSYNSNTTYPSYYSDTTYPSYYSGTANSSASSYYPNYYDSSSYDYCSSCSSGCSGCSSYGGSSYYGSSYSGCSSCSYGGGYTYTQPPQIVYNPPVQPPYYPPVTPPTYNTLNASCSINPSNVYINDTVTLSGSASGGTGSYSYYWSGSDGISGSSQVITGRFTSIGSKTVSLTVTSGIQTVTRSCNAYVNSNYNYNNNNNYNNNYNYGYNNNYSNLTATCSSQPSNANVGDNVVWTAYPTGGNGTYTYSWTGTDGLSYGNAYQIQQRYTVPGTKSATVTVYSSTGQTVTAVCNANIVGSSINGGTPISGIYLNEVPATGIDFNLKVGLYILGLVLWSAFVGFMIIEKKKAKLALANRSRIEDFKQENLKRKGLL